MNKLSEREREICRQSDCLAKVCKSCEIKDLGDEECPICFYPLKYFTDRCCCEYQLFGPIECGHIFHSHCFFNWFKQNKICPLCRRQVSTQFEVIIEWVMDGEKIYLPFQADYYKTLYQLKDEMVREFQLNVDPVSLEMYFEEIHLNFGKGNNELLWFYSAFITRDCKIFVTPTPLYQE